MSQIRCLWLTLPTEIRVGVSIAGAIAVFGLLFQRIDLKPLDGFWVDQPFDLSWIAGGAATVLAWITRLVLRREAEMHRQTREEVTIMVADIRKDLKEHMANEEKEQVDYRHEINERFRDIGKSLHSLEMLLIERLR